ncbi:mast/stem cell growth factor receptor Kit [Scaptodrosophila lebanonensis]|uniref:Mast/stem cell growth factor receptor Kit n=1 Tax=Drosophila lebanonensis TaxID=7225 RepID=A0A6J2U511_DROLE|nr:mast/stem cell growth factor receptor Kit [Scaptodrosophila lebanonensis]
MLLSSLINALLICGMFSSAMSKDEMAATGEAEVKMSEFPTTETTFNANNIKSISTSGLTTTNRQFHNNHNLMGQITELSTNVTLYMKKIPRLQVRWQDNLPKGTTYNVIVNAVNSTRCPEAPCSEYGKPKPSSFLYLPVNAISNVDALECSYMFGCEYKLTVETSNAKVSRSTLVLIPPCVSGECSCQLAPAPPKVLTLAKMVGNDTLSITFAVHTNEQWRSEQENRTGGQIEALRTHKMQIRVSEETNPSLPWGGKLKQLLSRFYNLNELGLRATAKGYEGSIKLPLGKQLKEKASLNLQALIIDASGCEGLRSVTRVAVPANPVLLTNDTNLSNGLIIAAILLMIFIFSGLLILCVQRRRRVKNKAQLQKEEIHLQSFAASTIEMEDNINYVDKYVEQSQALGLADIFEVPHSSIHIGRVLGEGAFGRVHEATAINMRRMRGTMIVAVKQLKNNPTADEVAEFLSEIDMLKGVGTHHNVVCFLGCCTIRAPYLMVMEYVGRGNLLNYLRTVRQEAVKFKTHNANDSTGKPINVLGQSVNYIELKVSGQTTDSEQSHSIPNGTQQPKPPLSPFAETTYAVMEDEEPFEYILDNRELHNFALQIANGMRFLEEQEITHRDLAARNVLIDNNKTLKISDFGLSRHGIYTNTRTRKLPLRWLSIEAICDNIYSSKSDVWAYGVVLWEIGTLGASPYPTVGNNELIPYLLAGNRLERPEICTPQVYTIMLQCWLEDPEERPTFDALYKVLSPKTTYVDINSLSDDYVFPPIRE